MSKVKTKLLPFPVPVCIASAIIKGKVNFATYGCFGLLSPRPLYVYIGSLESRYTNIGIKENRYFGVNIPSVDQMKETDYVGLVSGRDTDKENVFSVFYGEVDKAPLIEDCPVNMLCKLIETVDLHGRDIFIGEVIETYVNEEYITDGKLDFKKMNPLLLTPVTASYWELGNIVGSAYKAGKTMIKP
ncbi:flavin reductase family protein [Methanobacterium sp.]|uniref:flavin reductase family protein n=1 Tax=Methanobacterium sp. TaxID=2164 RepID=UPI003C72B4D7